MADKAKIAELVTKYKREAERSSLSEADVRAVYVDLLFSHLGWDVWKEDPAGATRYHREGYQRGAGFVDVGLEIGPQPVLILEAKRFGALPRSLERRGDRTSEEKQLFRYARSRRIPYGILTNFERLHVFNADHERLILAFDDPEEYLGRLNELERLTPDKVGTGSLPAWERQLEIKDIDETFLASMRDWRLRLANAIYEHNTDNPSLRANGGFDFAKLMAAVQRMLDRLILVRYADDRELLLTYDILDTVISAYRRKGAYAGQHQLMQEFVNLSHIMDDHHNTTLFQRGHVCEQVSVPNEVLAGVIEEMNSISFRKFTSDILGNTYESYLGTKLLLRRGRIESEERFDLRKGGGIYYTPTWVVRYIVDSTLGTLLNRLEEQHGLVALEKAKGIRVLDPACGSGSFLIYAYHVFADFYRRMNAAIEKRQVELLASGAAADMFHRLEAFAELPQAVIDYPHRILREHLYGVDVDPEAAEIAAVNLTMQAFADTKHEKLPLILNENIKVGNSLIGGTPEELSEYFGHRWLEKRPFNWEREFPWILAEGGFDVVVGNPPYVRIQTLPRDEAGYYRARYESAFGSFDIYVLFLEKAIQLLKPGGRLGFITSGKFLKSQYGERIREVLRRDCTVESVLDLSAHRVFAGATTYPAVTVLTKGARDEPLRYTAVPVDVAVPQGAPGLDLTSLPTIVTDQQALVRGVWPPVPTGDTLLAKLSASAAPLSEIADRVFVGLQTSADGVYILEKRSEPTDGVVRVYSRALERDCELESALLKPLLSGKDVERYVHPLPEKLLLFPYKVSAGKAELIPSQEFASSYPRCWEYLLENRKPLEGRERGKMRHERWYAYVYPKNLALHDGRKIAIPRLVKRLAALYDREGEFYLDNVDVGGLILKDASDHNYLYVMALLNSRLLDFYLRRVSVPFRGGFYSANRQFLEPLPIRRIDPESPEDVKRHDGLSALAGRMLELKRRLRSVPNALSAENHELAEDVELTDRAVDRLAYALYGLTEEEIATVEKESWGADFAEAHARLPTLEQAEGLAQKQVASQQRQETLERELERIKEVIVRDYQPDRIYLFGSLSQGTVHSWSDIDLCVVKNTSLRFLDRLKEITHLTHPAVAVSFTVYTPEEIAVFEREGHYFWKDEIVAKGKVIYESSSGLVQSRGRR